jgi:hypothetical protein
MIISSIIIFSKKKVANLKQEIADQTNSIVLENNVSHSPPIPNKKSSTVTKQNHQEQPPITPIKKDIPVAQIIEEAADSNKLPVAKIIED